MNLIDDLFVAEAPGQDSTTGNRFIGIVDSMLAIGEGRDKKGVGPQMG